MITYRRWPDVRRFSWNEEDHPRHPAGDDRGGEFAPSGEGESISVDSARERLGKFHIWLELSEGVKDTPRVREILAQTVDNVGRFNAVQELSSPGNPLIIQLERGASVKDYYHGSGRTLASVERRPGQHPLLRIATGLNLPSSAAPTLGSGNVGKDFNTILAHELSHLVKDRGRMGDEFRKIYDSKPKPFWAKKVSKYGSSNPDELFAEGGAAFTHPRYVSGSLPPELENFFSSKGMNPRSRKYEWNEDEHPRHPSGSEDGGEFAPKGGGSIPPRANVKSDPKMRRQFRKLEELARQGQLEDLRRQKSDVPEVNARRDQLIAHLDKKPAPTAAAEKPTPAAEKPAPKVSTTPSARGGYDDLPHPDIAARLAEDERQIAAKPHEHIRIYSGIDGQPLCQLTTQNSPNSVGVDPTTIIRSSKKNVVITHNHPGGGSSFSSNDLRFAAQLGASEMRAVYDAGDGRIGVFRVSMPKGKKWPSTKEIKEVYDRNYLTIPKKYWADPNLIRGLAAKGFDTRDKQGHYMINEIMEKTAKDLGMKYDHIWNAKL